MCKPLLLFLCFFSQAVPALSQPVIRGIVTDRETGEPLPSATVQIEGTYSGTITNQDGRFAIAAERFPVPLLIRYLGYEAERVKVEDVDEQPVLIPLSPSVTRLEEVVVTDRNPALSIMEKVIERKQEQQARLDTYLAKAYTRQILRNDSSIVTISESSSDLFWSAGKGYREVQTARQQTSNLSSGYNFAGVHSIPNLYNDNIEIAGYQIVGVTHPDALSYYDFKLIESSQSEEQLLWKIEVIPRRSLQPLFEGVVWVKGGDYALVEVQLTPNDVVRFPPPVQEFDLVYIQQFSDFGEEYWLPADMRIEGLLKLGMVGLDVPEIHFSQISRITGYQVNVELPDTLFQSGEGFVQLEGDSLDPNAEEQFGEMRIPLTPDEEQAYQTIDSTDTLQEAFQPEGFLVRMAESSRSDGIGSRLGAMIPGGLGIRGRYNRADGLHAGVTFRKEIPSTPFTTDFFAGYSTHSKCWDLGAAIEVELMNVNDFRLSTVGGYQYQTDTRYRSDVYSVGISSLMILLGGTDYFDYFRNERWYGGWVAAWDPLLLEARLTWQSERHRNFPEGSIEDYSLFGWHDPRRENPAIQEGLMNSVSVTLDWNTTNRLYGFAGARQFSVELETSRKTFGSDFNFTTVRLSGDWQFATFFQRRLFSNTLDLHFSAGISFGEVPMQKFAAVDGSRNRFTPFGVLRSRTYLPYEGTEYASLVAEHNFRSVPFELLGLNWFAEKGWGIILFAGAGITDVRSDYPYEVMTSDGIHLETGISLNSIFGLARLDLAKQIGGAGFFLGVSVPRYF